MDLKVVLDQDRCPIDRLLELISAKWTIQIVCELAIKPTRTRMFLKHIPGLSMKTLARRLKDLEFYGFIIRTVYPGKVMKVEYSLSERGKKLCLLLEEVKFLSQEMNLKECGCPIESKKIGLDKGLECPYRRQ